MDENQHSLRSIARELLENARENGGFSRAEGGDLEGEPPLQVVRDMLAYTDDPLVDQSSEDELLPIVAEWMRERGMVQ